MDWGKMLVGKTILDKEEIFGQELRPACSSESERVN